MSQSTIAGRVAASLDVALEASIMPNPREGRTLGDTPKPRPDRAPADCLWGEWLATRSSPVYIRARPSQRGEVIELMTTIAICWQARRASAAWPRGYVALPSLRARGT